MFTVSRRVGWSGEAESLQSRREVNATRTHATKREGERERDRRLLCAALYLRFESIIRKL